MTDQNTITDRIIFMGSPDFGLPTLEKIHQTFPENLVGIFTQPDRPKGRSKKLCPTPIKTWGLDNKVPVFQPEEKPDIITQITLLQPTLIIVIAYGVILPKEITDHFTCINVHGSILPDHRGASPIQASLLAGDKNTGVTLIRMNEGLDEGPILKIEAISISEEETFGSLYEQLQTLSANTLVGFIKDASQDDLIGTVQNHDQATYCHKIKKEDLLLDWSKDPQILLQTIKAFSPIPGAYTITQKGQRIKILDAKLDAGQLIPLLVKPEGKKSMSYTDFCRGNKGNLTC